MSSSRLNNKKFIIREATRKRCKIIALDTSSLRAFRAISLELYSYFHETDKIDFCIYFRAGEQMIEFIRPKELSTELLQQMWAATQVPNADVSIYVRTNDYPRFENMISRVRDKKLKAVIEKDSTLDPNVLSMFSDISAASQMIVQGGIDLTVAHRASAAVAHMMSSQIGSEAIVATLSRMIACDSTLYDHSATVAMLAGVIASRILKSPLSKAESEVVARSGLFHDTGKTCIPAAILNKPGAFTPEEFEVMKTHTTLGFDELRTAIARGAPIEDLVARVALEHHERFTGQGYPLAKKGRYEDNADEGIHLYSRIISIADVYSALLMKRIYKEPYPPRQALDIMMKIADRDFDPEIFPLFLQHVTASLDLYDQKEEEQRKSRITMIDKDQSFTKAIIDRGGR